MHSSYNDFDLRKKIKKNKKLDIYKGYFYALWLGNTQEADKLLSLHFVDSSIHIQVNLKFNGMVLSDYSASKASSLTSKQTWLPALVVKSQGKLAQVLNCYYINDNFRFPNIEKDNYLNLRSM